MAAVSGGIGAAVGALISQVVPARKVKVDEFEAIKAELRVTIAELRATIVEQGQRIELLEREVEECERGRTADMVAFSERIAELAVLVARPTIADRDL